MSRAAATAVLVLILSTGVWAQFEHPDLKSGKSVVKSAVILPPNVKIIKSGVKSNEEMIEESRLIENALAPLITSVLQERHCNVNDKTFAADTLDKINPKHLAENSAVVAVAAYALANSEQALPR